MKYLSAIGLTLLLALTPKSDPSEIGRQLERSSVKAEPVEAIEIKPQTLAKAIKAPEPVNTQVKAQNVPQGSQNVQASIIKWAKHYGVSSDQLLRIAKCESNFNPSAVNKGYNENGFPTGVFQHLSGYWPARAAKYGRSGASIYDADAQAQVTAGMFADGQSNQWACK